MVVPMRMPPWQRDDFAILLPEIFDAFIIVLYIPILYRTMYRIVAEKESKAKESMRMMGLKDFPYWASWYMYYTFVNMAIVSINCFITSKWVFYHTHWTIIFTTLWLFGQSLFGLIMVA